MTLINILLLILIGFAGGLAVGTAIVAFLTVLGIVPRLAQITSTYTFIQHYQFAIIIGSVFWTVVGLLDFRFHFSKDLSILFGSFAGIFVGMLAAALTEVLNVLPIMAKRVKMENQIVWLLMAMVFGKILGSLFHWIFYTPF